MDSQAILTLKAYMSFDSKELSNQQAVDRLEEHVNELQEKYGISISIDVQQRIVQKRSV